MIEIQYKKQKPVQIADNAVPVTIYKLAKKASPINIECDNWDKVSNKLIEELMKILSMGHSGTKCRRMLSNILYKRGIDQ